MRSRVPRRRHLTAALATATVLTMLSVTGISMADESGTADPPTTLISRDELIKQRDKIFDDLQARKISGLDGLSVGIDTTTGRLGVTVFIPPSKGAKSILGDLGAKSISLGLGANVDVKIIPDNGPTELASAEAGMFLSPEGGGTCTVGFTVMIKGGVVFNRGKKQGMVTSGHCFKPGLATKKNKFRVDSLDGEGSLRGAVNFTGHSKSIAGRDNNDWGLMTTDDPQPGKEAIPTIREMNAGPPSGTRSKSARTLRVVGTGVPEEGKIICKMGETTGATCGEIVQTDTVLFISALNSKRGAHKITGLFVSDACAERGDSGGPTYFPEGNDRAVAVGITTSGTLHDDKCLEKDGRTNVTYHLPLSRIPGATVVTTN